MRFVFLLVAVTLAACGRPDAVADGAENTHALPAANAPSPMPSGGPPANAVATEPGGEPGTATIPVALQGRWGLSPRDCTSSLGDAKGLLIVNANELRFYESRAVAAAGVQTSDNSVSGDFAFTGEGQNWTRHVTLELRDGKLVRTERDPISSFRYVRC
ncbi:MAG TPA: hypothetical protein VFU80_08700 [Sphingomicrobium sp.]|nr:hypothetical protein [Sphingomicrobium sp.]